MTNPRLVFSDYFLSASEGYLEWWRLTLPARSYIYRIRLYNRLGLDEDLINGVKVQLDDVTLHIVTYQPGRDCYEVREVDRVDWSSRSLQLAEVEVYGGLEKGEDGNWWISWSLNLTI